MNIFEQSSSLVCGGEGVSNEANVLNEQFHSKEKVANQRSFWDSMALAVSGVALVGTLSGGLIIRKFE